MSSKVTRLTPEQEEEVERRLKIPQACRVIAYKMGVSLPRILEIRTKLRAKETGGAPLRSFGESETAAAMPKYQHTGGVE
jgi:hypothetical protein